MIRHQDIFHRLPMIVLHRKWDCEVCCWLRVENSVKCFRIHLVLILCKLCLRAARLLLNKPLWSLNPIGANKRSVDEGGEFVRLYRNRAKYGVNWATRCVESSTKATQIPLNGFQCTCGAARAPRRWAAYYPLRDSSSFTHVLLVCRNGYRGDKETSAPYFSIIWTEKEQQIVEIPSSQLQERPK